MEVISELEKALCYTFRNKALLQEALTHSSFSHEGNRHEKDNERLEFLGDSVLSLIVAEHLFTHYRHYPEGDLTKLRASLVCEKSLFNFANRIGLGQFIRLGKGEENTGGRERPSIVSDAFEATLAAIYLDGGYGEARRFVLRFMPEHMDPQRVTVLSDYKTALQEIIQKNREERLEYVLTGESGPDHNQSVSGEVHFNSNVIGTGTGHSKKQAEQLAAKEALSLMGYET